MSTSTAPTPTPTLPATTRLGPAELVVASLDRSVAYYQDAAGLRLHHRGENGDIATATMGTGSGDDVLVLREDPLARPPGRHAGLFHVALLSPTREELSRSVRRIAAARMPISGASDHGVSEALYLRDPDGNGLELYADRPKDRWPSPTAAGERVGMFTRALDVDDLLAVTADEPVQRHAAAGLTVGHIHLHVGDVPQARAFYSGLLGFETMATYPGAEFLAAGGYHHHVAVNTWAGEGVGPAPEHTAGLYRWTVLLPHADDLVAVTARLRTAGAPVEETSDGDVVARDPWGTAVALRVAEPVA